MSTNTFDARAWGFHVGASVARGARPESAVWRNADGTSIDWQTSEKDFPRGYREGFASVANPRVKLLPQAWLVTRDGAPVTGRVHDSEWGAAGELHRTCSMSIDWAIRHEGYALVTVEHVDVWTPEEAQSLHATARNVFAHEKWHDTGATPPEYVDTHPDGFDDDDWSLIRESCGPCALRGYGAHDDDGARPYGPNYGAWGRLYVELPTHSILRRVPDEWRDAWTAELTEPTPYGAALRRSVRTFGAPVGAPVTMASVVES